jgi:uridine kinase
MTSVVALIADWIDSRHQAHPIRVAIDGPDASGKTTFANALADELGRRDREIIRASIDGFHLPRERRYRRGANSAEGYYLDSFDHHAVREELLLPLGPNGNRRCRLAVFNFRENVGVLDNAHTAKPDAVLLFDGVFLLRPELIDLWDLRIFLFIEFSEVLRRVALRDRDLFGSSDAAVKRYRIRYVPGQEIYFRTVRPWNLADVVLDNSDPTSPVILSAVSPPPGERALRSATPTGRAPEPQ